MPRVTLPSQRHAFNKGIPRFVVVFFVAISTAYLSVWCSSKASTYSILDLVSTEPNITQRKLRTPKSDEKGKERANSMTPNDPAFEMNAIPAPEYHLVVSTGCSTYQDWQSYVLFYHAMKSGQVSDTGPLSYVTRVVSGCNEEEKKKMNEIHEREIAPIAPGRFFIHHTPLYQFVKPGVNYVYFNKAFGYLHWLNNALRYPYNHQKYDNVIYILLDPDQILLRPFSKVFGDSNELWGGPFRDKRVVEQGQPFAQEYAFGMDWVDGVQMEKIAPSNELPYPVSSLTKQDLFSFMVGPPYIMTGFDLWRLVNKWVDFCPYVYDQLPEHISEMMAYSLAAAHLGLKHQVVHSLMVSNADVSVGEGWQLFEDTDEEDICENVQSRKMPHTLHYCQNYGLGKYFFSKYSLRPDFISCGSPLLKEPPSVLGALHDYWLDPGNQETKQFTSKVVARRNAFAVCYLIKSMNEAAVNYKQNNCDPSKANYNRTLAFFDDMTEQPDLSLKLGTGIA